MRGPIPIRRGRTLLAADSAGAPDVVVVNEALARLYFADGDPVGRRIWVPAGPDQPERTFEVVGLVADAKLTDLLAEQDARDISLFVGGTIPPPDIEHLQHLGVRAVFTPGVSAEEIITTLRSMLGERPQTA